MRKAILLFITAFFIANIQFAEAQNARIKIDVDRTVGEVDSLIYGNFLEHLGRAVYGGVYDPGSPLSNEKGFREDVMEAVKDLNVSLLRYPGGNFVSNYHWLDGVGPERTPRMELAWERLETNEFGTNEFMQFANAIEVYEVNGPDVKAGNDFDQTLVQTGKKSNLRVNGSEFIYSFPAHSFTMLIGKINTD